MIRGAPTVTLESVKPVAGPALGRHGGVATSVVPKRCDKEGESENPQLQRPLAPPQAVAPVTGQTVHLFIDRATEGSRDGPWSGVAASKVRDDYVSMTPNISARHGTGSISGQTADQTDRQTDKLANETFDNSTDSRDLAMEDGNIAADVTLLSPNVGAKLG